MNETICEDCKHFADLQLDKDGICTYPMPKVLNISGIINRNDSSHCACWEDRNEISDTKRG